MEIRKSKKLLFQGRCSTIWARALTTFMCVTLAVGFPVIPAMAALGKPIVTKGPDDVITITNTPATPAAAPEKTQAAPAKGEALAVTATSDEDEKLAQESQGYQFTVPLDLFPGVAVSTPMAASEQTANTQGNTVIAPMVVGAPVSAPAAAPAAAPAPAAPVNTAAAQVTTAAKPATPKGAPVKAAPGQVITTPVTPMELPVEIEIEVGTGSLKAAPLWKEIIQMLRNPYVVPLTGSLQMSLAPYGVPVNTAVVRRPGFGVTMPPLKAWSLDYNFLTAQPLRLRVSDGEVSWDSPGPLFDPAEPVPVDAFSRPTALRTQIGALVVDGGNNLVVSNPTNNPVIPPDGTIVAVPAVQNGVLNEMEGGELEEVVTLPIPVNEEDFFRTNTTGLPPELNPATRPGAGNQLPIGRAAAEVLGKALFWDMQVGSDSVQACGSCHFHAGADNRTRNQRNPNTNGPLGNNATLESLPASQTTAFNSDVLQGDFPFHNAAQDAPGTPNDVMSSMGVSRFKTFTDIPPIGASSFGAPVNGIRPLLPDIGADALDPVVVNRGFRRVEPRNTPTFHGAAFNFDNFWDGRARFHFNGGSVQGPSDPQNHIFINNGLPTGALAGATNGMVRPDLNPLDAQFNQPVRIKFSSLASQAVGPPLSDFEMSFSGRNWAKIGKKLLQAGVTPLANQLVSTTDSVLGPFSNQNIAAGMPGLSISYPDLIKLAYKNEYWANINQHLNGAVVPTTQQPPAGDPFDGYVLTMAAGAAAAADTNQFTQMEANFSLFFGLGVQAYESLTIPDHTPFDQFMDLNPGAVNSIGQPGEQGVLFPTLVRELVTGSTSGNLVLPPGFGPDEVYGFDLFAGANLSAALPAGGPRNPIVTHNGVPVALGSNPFTRTARCMLCHLGPEQTDHSINIAHGILKVDAEFEFPTPPTVPEPTGAFGAELTGVVGTAPGPESPGPIASVAGLILAEEVAGMAQDAVEVEPRNFATFDDPNTPWDDRIVAQPSFFALGDQGIYNVGLRPINEDIGRGANDPFNQPLSLAALTLKNIGGPGFEPNDGGENNPPMANFDPLNPGGTFENTGADQLINPGFERNPINPLMPAYMVPWINDLPAGELHPQIDEAAGMLPNVLTPPNGGPAIEFPEVMFGADLHCGVYDPATFGAGAPAFGWGPRCPQNQSGVANNFAFPIHGTWPVPNRVLRNGAFKAPSLRNVELTGPYFHSGSYLTLRQVVDFYLRGGDFPRTNAEDRDPHMVNAEFQAFGFGPTILALMGDVAPGGTFVNGFLLQGTFQDALPDAPFNYNFFPDSTHPVTPEPSFPSRAAALEDARNAIVKFLIALTDPRVKFERAPFDRPEIFVPIDGTAPENTGGRTQLLADSVVFNTPVPPPGNTARFKRVPEVGSAGNAQPLPNFLGISSTPVPGPNNDHFDPNPAP